jgi:hypothetical protein
LEFCDPECRFAESERDESDERLWMPAQSQGREQARGHEKRALVIGLDRSAHPGRHRKKRNPGEQQ